MRLKNLLFLIAFLCSTLAFAQQRPPFYQEIEAFKKADSVRMPVKNGILFVGSSSFTMWKDLEKTYQKYQAINRGFGGSNLANAIYYADDIIFPYQPRQIVIYSGENDIAEGATPDVTFDRFKLLFSLIRKKMPNVAISFISIKPSLSREKFMPQMLYANELIKTYLQTQTNVSFIDVYHLMLQENGKPMSDIFIKDNLHMNQKGYDIWTKTITPYLIQQ
ncbi:GDSL-type esterase/lipase family protein [Pedobacter cryophilus]|uniref:G-D-S-L family lipolytic protein n=1 Tax=Pedobacter cryophilus TaxID=2571271 RepID=A0A4U1C4H2_9SPHI|nr:GDSL-type esterase/lipase family protein [Pedobacter cryophilus]TKC00145.1 G-D-S-L family lipolytic protein [Pedobacter cryophilus]